MGLHDIALLPSRAYFSTTFHRIVVEVYASSPPHLLKLWLGVSKGMLLVKYVCSTKPLFVSFKFHGDRRTEIYIYIYI